MARNTETQSVKLELGSGVARIGRARAAIFATLALIGLSPLIMLPGCKSSNCPGGENKTEPPQIATPMAPASSNSPVPITRPINYVALGDSTGAGVGAKEGGYVGRLFKRIWTRSPGSELTNLCVSGATTSDVLRGQLERGLSQNPNLVTLGIGINDIGHGFSLDEFASNYDQILSRLKKSTSAVIVVTNIPDISSAPRIPQIIRDEYHGFIVNFNRKLEEIAARHGVTVFDVYMITHEQLPGHPEYFSGDGFHPSDKGYELWAEKMWPTVARAIGERP